MYLTAEKFDIPLEAFPAHIKELKNRIESPFTRYKLLAIRKAGRIRKVSNNREVA